MQGTPALRAASATAALSMSVATALLRTKRADFSAGVASTLVLSMSVPTWMQSSSCKHLERRACQSASTAYFLLSSAKIISGSTSAPGDRSLVSPPALPQLANAVAPSASNRSAPRRVRSAPRPATWTKTSPPSLAGSPVGMGRPVRQQASAGKAAMTPRQVKLVNVVSDYGSARAPRVESTWYNRGISGKTPVGSRGRWNTGHATDRPLPGSA